MKKYQSSKLKIWLLIVFIIVIHLLLDSVYRPWVKSNKIADFGLSDSFTQLTSVIGISLLMVALEKAGTWKGKTGLAFLVIVPVAAMIIYEFIQLLITHATFDPKDLYFTLLGGFFTYLIQHKLIGVTNSQSG